MQEIPCLYKGFEKYCPYNTKDNSCQGTVHHLWWPKRLYKGPLRRRFRGLLIHKVKVCRGIHDLFHLINVIPKTPTIKAMKGAVNDEKQRKVQQEEKYLRQVQCAQQQDANKSDE